MRKVRMLVALVLWGGCLGVTSASDFLPTARECHEASDFIRNAALSRDNGYSKKFLLGRFDDDMMVLSGMDPQKRWFVRSKGATQFLRQALHDVFVVKRKPGDQAGIFLRSCMAHVLALSPEDL